MKQSNMVISHIVIIFAVFGTVLLREPDPNVKDVEGIEEELENFEYEYTFLWWGRQTADWEYSTNITSESIARRERLEGLSNKLMKKWKLWAKKVYRNDLPTSIKEVLDMISGGLVIMNEEDAKEIIGLKSKLVEIYSLANTTISELNITVQGESEYGSLMGKIRDPDTLLQLWKSWRTEVGENTHPFFLNLIKLSNKAAQDNGYADVGSYWRRELGSDNILDTAFSLFEEIKPLYAHLHAYVQHKLKQTYGEKYVSADGLIPAHLLGSLWGENWVALNDILTPYPEQEYYNLTEIFKAKNYSIGDIMNTAEFFYRLAGLERMSYNFWLRSMFVKPTDGRIVDCHPASYDFNRNCDYRVRMCAEVKEQSFLEVVHEMGHIQYYMAYRKLPILFRNGANSAFHEAVGETMVYSVQNPQCLKSLNLIKSPEISREMFINLLMKQALSKVVLLPFSLVIEKWRYALLAGDINEETMNEYWWELRESIQGLEAPDEESRKLFDAGTKYHIIYNIPYMRYFIGRFLEHMFLESLCENGDVHNCCFVTDKEAGQRFLEVLKSGSTLSWRESLKKLTGKRKLSARPLLKYYEPLYQWLVDYNTRHNIPIVL